MSYMGKIAIDPPVSMKLARQIKGVERGDNGIDSYCDFEVGDDGDTLEHTGAEKSRDEAEWIAYLIKAFFAPAGHVLNGVIEVEDSEYVTRMDLIVRNNVVFTQDYAWTKSGPETKVE